MTLGTPRLHLRATDSTNERARELAITGAPHGTLVTAAVQTAGRGRQGRVWSAPPGRALLMSLLLRDPPPLLSLTAAVAVAGAIGIDAAIKWPNDVLIGDPPTRKVAGILVEGRPREGWAVLGIGVNVAVRVGDLPPDLRCRAGTLGRAPHAVEDVLAAVLDRLVRELERDPRELLAEYRLRDALVGRPVRWTGGAGVARGVDERGRLIVEHEDGRREGLRAGEVHLGG